MKEGKNSSIGKIFSERESYKPIKSGDSDYEKPEEKDMMVSVVMNCLV